MHEEKKQSKPEGIKKINEAPPFEMKDLATILLLVFIYPIGLIFMWLATKWPKWIKLLLTLPIIFAIIAMSLAVFFIYKLTSSNETPSQLQEEGIMCTQEVKLCPDGKTYVGREGPACEFIQCPQADPEDLPATEEAIELPEASVENPKELFPTAPVEE